jgi:hypothetical protein
MSNVCEIPCSPLYMWSGCEEMREREGKERREILSEDGREIGWMKEVWKGKERGGNRN